jgi:hypothetical protein
MAETRRAASLTSPDPTEDDDDELTTFSYELTKEALRRGKEDARFGRREIPHGRASSRPPLRG